MWRCHMSYVRFCYVGYLNSTFIHESAVSVYESMWLRFAIFAQLLYLKGALVDATIEVCVKTQ